MAEINDPGFLQNGSHPAQMMNLLVESIVSGGGVADKDGGDLLVSEKSGTPNMSVDVAAGGAFVPGDEATAQGAYFTYNDGVVNLTITAADATDDRHDLIVAVVEDSQYSGATDDWSLAVVTGTPAASPSDPATDSNSITLARVVVPALASSITDADITDLRTQAEVQPRMVAPSMAIEGASTQVNAALGTTSNATYLTLNFPDPGGPVSVKADAVAATQGTSAGHVAQLDINIDGDRPLEEMRQEHPSSFEAATMSQTHARTWTPSGAFTVTMELWANSTDVQHLASSISAIMIPA